jgi:hypothetical protein
VRLFAICEPPSTSTRAEALVLLALALLSMIVIAVLVLHRPEERAGLIGTYLATAVIGTVITLTPGGLSANDADYAARSFVAVAVGAAAGLGMSALRRRRPLGYLISGLLGGATFTAGVIGLLAGGLAISGSCFD